MAIDLDPVDQKARCDPGKDDSDCQGKSSVAVLLPESWPKKFAQTNLKTEMNLIKDQVEVIRSAVRKSIKIAIKIFYLQIIQYALPRQCVCSSCIGLTTSSRKIIVMFPLQD